MDSRTPSQHPYARNTTSPYSRAPFQSPSQAPFPPPSAHSHSQPPQPGFERPIDTPFYARSYASETGGHSRHQSSSSIGHRTMPPPSSPQQQQQTYAQPLPRGPPSLGPPMNFPPSGRDLPSLSSIVRPGSAMSISSMLGGPPPSTAGQYPPISAPSYSSSMQASPRAATVEYPRRPQTPEYGRPHDPGMRDVRAASAGSPRGPNYTATPDSNRYSTPQGFPGGASQGSAPPPEERRDSLSRVLSGGSVNAAPPRPNSQPTIYNPPHRLSDPPRLAETAQPVGRTSGSPRMAEVTSRLPAGSPPLANHAPERYDRPQTYPYQYAERDSASHAHERRDEMREREMDAQRDRDLRAREYMERDARDRELRDRELRDRELRDREDRERRERGPGPYPAQAYRPEREGWNRPFDQPERPGYDYRAYPGYPAENRYPEPAQDRRPPSYTTAAYPAQESPRGRPAEDPNAQRGLLAVGPDINRKGRTSPLPQAVQGVQGQMLGPAGEPGIKSEFGRMFAGIGSGVGREMAASSQLAAAALPFPPRSDPDALETDGGVKLVRTASGRSIKRRKVKEEEIRDEEDRTARAKRTKPHHHHHPPGHHHHHHHHHHTTTTTTTKDVGEEVPVPDVHRHHHHHHHTATKPVNIIIPKPKQEVRSAAVLDIVAHLQRRHLGYAVYDSKVEVNRKLQVHREDRIERGFMTTPRPLPRFEEGENCTFTVRVPRIHLDAISREEITSNRPLWGTDIYTDDSDVIAACIHSGWIRGAWPESVDVSLLDLVLDGPEEAQKDTLTEPPARGPMVPRDNKDLHITVLILPALEHYSSTVRWGIRSREWKSNHDGNSFMIHSIKWVDHAAVSSKDRRMRMTLALKDSELEEEKGWGAMFDAAAENPYGTAIVKESYARGDAPDTISFGHELTGLGTKSWWLQPAAKVAAES